MNAVLEAVVIVLLAFGVSLVVAVAAGQHLRRRNERLDAYYRRHAEEDDP